MRPIDADALEELFREVIGGIAKKPEMNGNLEHMVRASAMVIEMIKDAPTIEERTEERTETHECDLISRQAAIEALEKALYDYEDKTEKQFQESDDLDVCDWIQHRIFVQNMSDIDRQTILHLPSAERTGQWIPCKERHPKERGKYLVSFTEGNQLHVSICDWQVTTRHWNLTGCRSYWHPVAWMPLPEPYEEGGDN